MWENFQFYLLYSLIYLFSLLPMRILYFFSDLLALVLEHLIRYRHQVILSNLGRSFPEKSAHELKMLRRSFYKHFSDILFENIKSISQPMDKQAARLEIKHAELLEKVYKEGRSCLLLVGHYANWEYVKIGLYNYSPFINQAVYRPLQSPVFNRLLKASRNRYNGVLIPQNEMARSLLGEKEKQTLTLILYDQSPSNLSQCHWYSFLGQDTAFYNIVNKLSSRTGSAVIFGRFSKVKRGHYRLSFELLDEKDPIGDYVKKLEEEIRDDPPLWLWSHRRWKAKKKVG